MRPRPHAAQRPERRRGRDYRSCTRAAGRASQKNEARLDSEAEDDELRVSMLIDVSTHSSAGEAGCLVPRWRAMRISWCAWPLHGNRLARIPPCRAVCARRTGGRCEHCAALPRAQRVRGRTGVRSGAGRMIGGSRAPTRWSATGAFGTRSVPNSVRTELP